MIIHTITGGGGVKLVAQETGVPDGPAILFIHGFSQSRHAWAKQLNSDLAARFRLIALDLRGHGDSERPRDKYGDSSVWAEDVNAVIEALELQRPVIVAWSYGGVVTCDYLRYFGDRNISGIVLVGAISKVGTELVPHLGSQLLPIVDGLTCDDEEAGSRAVRRFAELCFHKQPPADEFEFVLRYNMQVPSYVRRSLFAREVSNADVLAKVRVPALIIHGLEDALVNSTFPEEHSKVIPHSRLVLFSDVGHSPFSEAPERFNAEVRSFCEGAFARSG